VKVKSLIRNVEKITDVVENLSYIIKTKYIFLTLSVENNLENFFRGRVCKWTAKSKNYTKNTFPKFCG
jgi:ABC-type branched-subunit amino acid transport system ATPase component